MSDQKSHIGRLTEGRQEPSRRWVKPPVSSGWAWPASGNRPRTRTTSRPRSSRCRTTTTSSTCGRNLRRARLPHAVTEGCRTTTCRDGRKCEGAVECKPANRATRRRPREHRAALRVAVADGKRPELSGTSRCRTARRRDGHRAGAVLQDQVSFVEAFIFERRHHRGYRAVTTPCRAVGGRGPAGRRTTPARSAPCCTGWRRTAALMPELLEAADAISAEGRRRRRRRHRPGHRRDVRPARRRRRGRGEHRPDRRERLGVRPHVPAGAGNRLPRGRRSPDRQRPDPPRGA